MKTIIVSGGTKGIGKTIVELFAEKKFSIAFCARNKHEVDALSKSLQTQYKDQNIIGFVCDVSKKDQVIDFCRAVQKEFSQIDVLVNNAGVFVPGNLYNEPDGTLEKQIETNVYSAYYMSKTLVPTMIQQKSGHIFNISSIAGLQAYPNGGSYVVSKFAMRGMGLALREELKSHHIRVTNVLPGAVRTASWDGVDLPEERFMKATDIAKSVYDIYCLSDRTVVEEIILRPQLGDI